MASVGKGGGPRTRDERLGGRAWGVVLLSLLLLGTLGARLVYLQVLDGPGLAQAAHAQRTQRLALRSTRGLVLDRQERPLTGPQSTWGLAAFPVRLAAPNLVAQVLHEILGDPADELAERLGASSDAPPPPLWLSRTLTTAQAERLRDLGLPGLEVAPVVAPFGPDSLAHHLVGYLNSEGGQGGLQAQLNSWLEGESQPALSQVLDGQGRLISGLADRGEHTPGRPPYDVITTIDLDLQRRVEQILDESGAQRQLAGLGPLRAAAVVVDVATGGVLALVSRPDFDPVADPGSRPDDGTHFLLNRALQAYAPGSIFKVIVAAEALQDGLVKPTDTYDCKGSYDLGDYHPHDDTPGGHGRLSFADALAVSCNVTFIHVGYDLLGPDRLLAAAHRFGLGEPTALGLPGEQAGFLPSLGQDYQVAQMSFGQGLTVTPVQMAQVMQVIAHAGKLMPLHVVDGMRDGAGHMTAPPLPRPQVRQVLEPWVVDQLRTLMTGVTMPGGRGTGQAAWVPTTGSAGKTGSAEGTIDGQAVTHAWFMGYAPLAEPKVAVVVFVEGGGLGGMVAAPLFGRIAGAALR